MGCMHGKPAVQESEIEKCAHVRRKTQHLIQNLVHEEFRLKVEEVRAYTGCIHSGHARGQRSGDCVLLLASILITVAVSTCNGYSGPSYRPSGREARCRAWPVPGVASGCFWVGGSPFVLLVGRGLMARASVCVIRCTI